MTRNKYLTNQEFLTELETRLPNFTQDDFINLVSLLSKHQQEFNKAIQAISSQTYNWIQEKIEEHEREETDKEVEKMKKSLETK